MNHSHLSCESEFSYFISWFRNFSDYEKSDFQEILLKWLLNKNEVAQMNGVNENGTKKTSIFHCRMKLFKEWSARWPDQMRAQLIEKLNDLDTDFGQKLNESLEAHLENTDDTNNAAPVAAVAASADNTNDDGLLLTTNGVKEEEEVNGETQLQHGINALTVNEE